VAWIMEKWQLQVAAASGRWEFLRSHTNGMADEPSRS
jgi:hypothetical protein